MSFREKHLWISIVASVGVWGWYFWFLIRHVMDGRLVNDHFTSDVSLAFMGCLVLVVVIEAVLTIIATLTTPKHEQKTRDEREIHAALKASHVALMALIGLVFCVSMGAYFAGLIDDNLVGGAAVCAEDCPGSMPDRAAAAAPPRRPRRDRVSRRREATCSSGLWQPHPAR